MWHLEGVWMCKNRGHWFDTTILFCRFLFSLLIHWRISGGSKQILLNGLGPRGLRSTTGSRTEASGPQMHSWITQSIGRWNGLDHCPNNKKTGQPHVPVVVCWIGEELNNWRIAWLWQNWPTFMKNGSLGLQMEGFVVNYVRNSNHRGMLSMSRMTWIARRYLRQAIINQIPSVGRDGSPIGKWMSRFSPGFNSDLNVMKPFNTCYQFALSVRFCLFVVAFTNVCANALSHVNLNCCFRK